MILNTQYSMTSDDRTSPFSRLAHYPIQWDLNEEIVHGERSTHFNYYYDKESQRNSMLRADNIHHFNEILRKISDDRLHHKSKSIWSKFEKWIKSMSMSSSKKKLSS